MNQEIEQLKGAKGHISQEKKHSLAQAADQIGSSQVRELRKEMQAKNEKLQS